LKNRSKIKIFSTQTTTTGIRNPAGNHQKLGETQVIASKTLKK